jgi:hypothetical protein
LEVIADFKLACAKDLEVDSDCEKVAPVHIEPIFQIDKVIGTFCRVAV